MTDKFVPSPLVGEWICVWTAWSKSKTGWPKVGRRVNIKKYKDEFTRAETLDIIAL